MKFHLQTTAGQNLFTGHGTGYVAVNGTRYTRTILVTSDRVIEDWPPTDFASLRAEHFDRFVELKPDVVLLGTGPSFKFLPPQLTQALHAANIGLEIMDNAAVCRTFNILLAEGRTVVAAVLLG